MLAPLSTAGRATLSPLPRLALPEDWKYDNLAGGVKDQIIEDNWGSSTPSRFPHDNPTAHPLYR
ncbi:protein of unknown function [Candidatus Methylocalor cossyra]|uniref:Uncharacterized protein n=1 Tax=Candidatus Methylocalor cossyra TaxID=3108543 RepID=A0ABP1C8E4_9GAMM